MTRVNSISSQISRQRTVIRSRLIQLLEQSERSLNLQSGVKVPGVCVFIKIGNMRNHNWQHAQAERITN